jgi:hypothetical protein
VWVREPAKSPAAARKRYVRFFQLSLSCLTKAIWVFGPGPASQPDDVVALVASDAPIHLRCSNGLGDLFLTPTQLFKIIPDTRFSGEYKARTLAYIYSVQVDSKDAENAELIAWHWHPLTTPDRVEPHMHVQATPPLGLKVHMPSGRVSFEQVVRFLVDDLHIEPRRKDWRTVIDECDQRFRAFRTWG